MREPGTCETIEAIRAEIDAIDGEIMILLGRRFGFVKEIVRFKNDTGEIVAQKRYDEVIARRRELAGMNGLNPDIIEKMYRTLMDHFIEEEMKLLEKKTELHR
jgi:isochorismate pyruvate lyase